MDENGFQNLLVDQAHLLPPDLTPGFEALAVHDSVVDALRLDLLQFECMSQFHQEPLLSVRQLTIAKGEYGSTVEHRPAVSQSRLHVQPFPPSLLMALSIIFQPIISSLHQQ